MTDSGISNLLDLLRQVIDQEDGYWVKIEAWQADATTAIPHGIRYSLTLHKPSGLRIMGYDNAHAVRVPSGYSGRKLPYDHKHRSPNDQGIRYDFKDAHQLLSDFFIDVDKVLRADKGK